MFKGSNFNKVKGLEKKTLLNAGFFFNDYSAMEATWVAGKLSFENLRLSFDILRLSFEFFNSSFLMIHFSPANKLLIRMKI